MRYSGWKPWGLDWFSSTSGQQHWKSLISRSHHRPGKAQTHVDALSWLLIEQAPPDWEEAALAIQPLADEEAIR